MPDLFIKNAIINLGLNCNDFLIERTLYMPNADDIASESGNPNLDEQLRLITMCECTSLEACLKFAKIYETGQGDPKDDLEMRIKCLKNAARLRHIQSYFDLAKIYEARKDETNYEQYMVWAASFGHQEALRILRGKKIAAPPAIKKLSTLFLAMRYKDSLPVLDAKEGSADTFKALAKSMLLGYGSSHAGHYNTVFKDSYGRDIDIEDVTGSPDKRKTELFGRTIDAAMLVTPGESKVVPIIASASVSSLLKKNNPKQEIITKEVAGRKFMMRTLSSKDAEQGGALLIKKLAILGASPNRDAQLWLAANVGDFKENFADLFRTFNFFNELNLDSYIESMSYRPSTETAEALKMDILAMLKKAESGNHDVRQLYYIKVFEKLITAMPKCRFDDPLRSEQNRLAYSRLKFIINQAFEKSAEGFEIFFACLEYAFQELQFINAANGNYSEADIRQSFTAFIREQYGSEDIDTHVLLAGSGMSMTTTITEAALSEVRDVEGFQSAKIYVDGTLYFEIPRMMRLLTDKSFPIEHKTFTCVEMDAKGQIKKISDAKNEILDIIISAFQENVGLTHPDKRFRSRDIDPLIRNQLRLREQASSDKRLIVVLDTTLTAINDVQMRELLMTYKKEIQSGKLAILTAHSLNKYFHMGFDKVPTGLGTAFYNAKSFPRLNSLCQNEWLSDFLVTDPIPQMLTHMIKHISPQILHYNDIVKGNARFVYGELVPEELMHSNPDSLVILYQPYTTDFHKDIWGFFVIEFNKTKDTDTIKFSKIVRLGIETLLEKFRVNPRDGYGFNKSGYSILQKPSNPYSHLRVSIGTESQDELRIILVPAINYITKVNELMELYTDEKFLSYRNPISSEELEDKLNALLNKELSRVSRFSSIPAEPNADTKEYFVKALGAEKKDMKQAIIFYRFAAIEDHPKALARLGEIYAEGLGVKKDIKKAVKYFIRAAESGSGDGMFRLAQCYAEGNGVRKDTEKSLRLYQEAAERNQPDALFYIGNCYEKGLGMKADLRVAESYYLKAAKLNQPDALFALGTLNESLEKGLLRNGKALEFYHQATDHGHVPALLKIGLYYKNLAGDDPENRAEAFKYLRMVVEKGKGNEKYKSLVADAQRELKAGSGKLSLTKVGHFRKNHAINDSRFNATERKYSLVTKNIGRKH